WFLLDLRPSIDFGSQQVRKQSVSAEFVAVLARLLTLHGNRVGAIFFGGGDDGVMPPRGGRTHVLQMLHRMQPRPRPAGDKTPPPGETDLGALLHQAHGTLRRRSVVFVVSDFISRPGWPQRLARLAQRHEVAAVRLYDPLERELPDLGLVTMQDAETGEQLFVDTHDAGFRRRFVAAAQRREAELRAAFVEAAVDVLELSTDDDLADALLRFADLRRQRSRAGAGGGLPAHLGHGLVGASDELSMA
ncbi:MAG: DUF58 domain-containing protein, partial [Burkholderiaceae bacterium]